MAQPPAFPRHPDRFCITDVGSTTTKAVLFYNDGGWRFARAEAPTTVEKPYEDVTVGVLQALRMLEQTTGTKLVADDAPALPFLSTSSAGGGLAMVVTGLVRELTADSADRAALGAGAIVLDVIAMNDGRTPYRKIEDLKTLRPDMVLLAGGFDADNITGPVFLAELILEAGLHPKLNPGSRLPVLYAGNSRARQFVQSALGDVVMFRAVPNIRPDEETENYTPARAAIHELFMNHVMSQAPGFERLASWVGAPILPTPAAFARILGSVSAALGTTVLAVDIGGATTDVFTTERGRVRRTVSANLGMSYSVLNVCEQSGAAPILELLSGAVSATELWNRIGDKHIHPNSLPRSGREMMLEWATAAIAVRAAVHAHFAVLHDPEQPAADKDINDLLRERRRRRTARPPSSARDYGMLIGSGGILSHSPRPAAARVLVDALDPAPSAQIAVDNEFIFPHLGILSEVNPELAAELFFKLGLIRIGPAVKGSYSYPSNYVPAAPKEPKAPAAVCRGPIVLVRELAIAGMVAVRTGDAVAPGTVVARSTRQFLRPFFLHAAEGLEVGPGDLPAFMRKKVGDTVAHDDVIASRPRRFMPPKNFRSPVDGRLEKILPGGALLVRESPESAREFTTVDVARELGVEPERLGSFLRCEQGQEVERGQWLAAVITASRVAFAASPVRGKVNRIDRHLGMVVIEPLLEELEVRAWLPGVVTAVSDRGATVSGSGVAITGVWGTGGETFGELNLDVPGPGRVWVVPFADADAIARAHEEKVAGLVAAGVNAVDVLDPVPGFSLVVTDGFGAHEFDPGVLTALREHAGRLCLVDGTTQLRVGVRRPRVLLPD